MKNTQATVLLNDLSGLTREMISKASKSLVRLSEKQLNWKSNPETWSINQIFAHLNAFSGYYHPALRNRIEKTKFREPRDIFVSSPLGRSAWKSMKLGNAKNVKRKFRAQKEYNPDTFDKELLENEVAEFLKSQEEMLVILKQSEEVDLRKVKIPTSISKMVKLRLGDCLQYVVFHNERHLYQAINLTKHRGFPLK